MSDTVVLGHEIPVEFDIRECEDSEPALPKIKTPDYAILQKGLDEASILVDDIVLKNYLNILNQLEIKPLDKKLKNISDIRMFKITEMVYQKNEYSTYKFASVFSAVQNLNCGVFILVKSDGKKTDFYMGVRNFDNMRTTDSLNSTLKNALSGQFPGVKTERVWDKDAQNLLSSINYNNISIVSCVAQNKDVDFKNNDSFIQGLEKLSLAMQGQSYTAIILAKGSPADELSEIRHSYETIYTQLSPFSNMQISYGSNQSLNISDAFSHGKTIGTSHSTSISKQSGKSYSHGISDSNSITETDTLGSLAKGLGTVALGAAGLIAAPLTGGASIAATGALIVGQLGLNAFNPKSRTNTHSINEGFAENKSTNYGEVFSENKAETNTNTHTEASVTGISDNVQLSLQNKSLQNTLSRIDLQLKRIEECESLGMWECAAYFLSDSQETSEMAASTYKALMKGEKSGVETSAVNFWGRSDKEKRHVLFDYISNFIHPVFVYNSDSISVPVTAASLVSSNELAIHMGFPRKSVCGFPVIEHADFGKEVVKYSRHNNFRNLYLGNVFNMGCETQTKVKLDFDSLTMHTFITGSTGSGKSNVIYEIINQARSLYNIPFLVVEPAKGEYKNIFGRFPDVTVYGTNPNKAKLLKINPFRFPKDIHVLEHIDRLVEIFNVCWPMYAAMPSILKGAIENSYVSVGWDLECSVNLGDDKYPNFADLLEQIEQIIKESSYSSDSKGDYSGALVTRVRSLTNGLNKMLFSDNDLSDSELFDESVIVDLSRVGSTETKSLIMGLLIMKLNEYRISSEKINNPLSHITVIEEAHNLLKRTSLEQSSESSNLLGKSVELIANSIAEMRTYGEGFIIADQSPGLLDISVIRNTNTKIILRLPEKNDRELVGYAAGLNDEQIGELSKLRCGVAAVYQNDWIEPVLVQIKKCELKEEFFHFSSDSKSISRLSVKKNIIHFLIQGRLNEKLFFSVDEIEKGLSLLNLSSLNIAFIEEQIEEYKSTGRLSVWNDEQFKKLSKRIVDILDVRSKVENLVLSSSDNDELSERLNKIVHDFIPEANLALSLALSQCMMKDMSIKLDETDIRQKIYCKWIESIKERWV